MRGPSVDPLPPRPEYPWREPLARETERAYDAFRLWLEVADDQRSLTGVGARIGVRTQNMSRWASRWHWRERLGAYLADEAPRFQARIARAFLRASADLSDHLAAAAKSPDARSLTVRELASAAKDVTYLARLTNNQSTDNIDLRVRLDATHAAITWVIAEWVPEEQREACLVALEARAT